MNSLELDIKEELNGNEIEFWLNLKIDGEEFLKRIDKDLNAAIFEELENSLKGDNEYLIFTCECGVADCGGWKKTKVKHLEGKTTWIFDYNDVKYNFEFDAQLYKNEIDRMRIELNKSKLKLKPEFILDPE
ncbi:hypothetical protein [Flavobacterium stagni]|uniref:Uncharacterized protein n=1 Tax=Flavobacterium stagni TaxID=2506421 RepID=A0A4Q1K9I4_9FLAO|nr:hypothetical protein [Flavobacterium stagni]RXR22625.1 hypothetical protein EQG61_08570 [Flavobacterium stagni]